MKSYKNKEKKFHVCALTGRELDTHQQHLAGRRRRRL